MSGGSHLTAKQTRTAGDGGKLFRILAAVCFLALAILSARSMRPLLSNAADFLEEAFGWGFSFYWLCQGLYCLLQGIAPVWYLLAALGALLGKRVFVVIGAAFSGLGFLFISLTHLSNAVHSLPLLAAWVLLLPAACSRGKKCRIFGITAAVLRLAAYVILLIQGMGFAFRSALYALVFMAGAVLLGMAFAAKAAPEKKRPGATPAPAPRADRFEQLMQLKELLDAGILTQEEFEAKKAELLR